MQELELIHSECQSIYKFFEYKHLPPFLQNVSKEFHILATKLMDLNPNHEKVAALRKLLEAKDAAVRAAI